MTQPTLPTPPPEQDALREWHERTLGHFWDLAYAACEEIATFRPDLVVALYRSGQAALRATQAAWPELHTGPFPPVVCTNLGREKTARYETLSQELGHIFCGPSLDILLYSAHFLAWVAGQSAWQAELQAQIHAVLDEDRVPARILVLDDFSHRGATWLSALGLLNQLYPNAEAHFMSGYLNDWQTPMVRTWLREHHPEAFARMEADAQAQANKEAARIAQWRYSTEKRITNCTREGDQHQNCYEWASEVVVGTESIDPESLSWRTLTPDSEILIPLLPYLPAETWLTMSEAIYTRIEKEMQQRAHAQVLDPQPQRRYGITSYRLMPDDIMMREMWRRRRLTHGEVMALTSLPLRQATRLLETRVKSGILVQRGRGRESYYEIPYTCGILAYGDLPADPDGKIAVATEGVVAVTTPFPVEFAHAAISRAGAPTLTLVPNGLGAPVPAQILLMRPDMDPSAVKELLSSYGAPPVSPRDAGPDNQAQPSSRDKVSIKTIHDLAGIPTVFVPCQWASLKVVLRRDLTDEEKAEELAKRAVLSVTPETYARGTDGIRYLEEVLRHAIHTPLADAYRAAILRLADDAPDLETARRRIAEKIPPKSS